MNRTDVITGVVLVAAFCIVGMTLQFLIPGSLSDTRIWTLILVALGICALFILKYHNTPITRRGVALLAVIIFTGALANLMTGVFPIPPEIQIMLVTAGLVLVTLFWRMHLKAESGLQDERTLRIGTYGLSCSWYLTFMVIVMLGLVIALGEVQVDTGMILMILLVLMPVSSIIFQWYFNRKGDVY
ncbi:MAG: hypothetical protein LUQ07_02030 [Methanospirillum sp.]|nr:hypothetical protein [Methanospirillum sp.]